LGIEKRSIQLCAGLVLLYYYFYSITMFLLLIGNILAPKILAVEKDFIVVYKPPRMHSAAQSSTAEETILDWCFARFPEIAELPGRKPAEGGLLHRLDYETQGLMLLAKSRLGIEALLVQQQEGKFFKEYNALSGKGKMVLWGWPSETPRFPSEPPQFPMENLCGSKIISAFRAYGPGRKEVRPVLQGSSKGEKEGKLYVTEILESNSISADGQSDNLSFRLRITKGFRHQIRSHLAWSGWPILNDSLYGGRTFGGGLLALRAVSLLFSDPSSGEERSYSIPPLSFDEIQQQ
jgi:23S rRNA pseudouridine1911/1915/1917 synthase